MHPTLMGKPFHRTGWVDEEKVDGWRIIPYKDGRTTVDLYGHIKPGQNREAVDRLAALTPPSDAGAPK